MTRSVSNSIGVIIALVLCITLGTAFALLFFHNQRSTYQRVEQSAADINEFISNSITFAMSQGAEK